MSENTVNAKIGEKIRTLRHMNGMNQTDLGKKIGVTFQQIQKYEKGYNNIVASKLYDLACKMNVDIAYFFEDINKGSEDVKEALSLNEGQAEFEFVQSKDVSNREAIYLVKLYNNIKNSNTRKRLLLFLKSVAEPDNEEVEF